MAQSKYKLTVCGLFPMTLASYIEVIYNNNNINIIQLVND